VNSWIALKSTVVLFLLGGCLNAQDLPLLGLNHVGIAVSDIDKARLFYHDVLGLDMGFDLVKPDLTLFLQYYKVNDHEYIEIYPTLKPDSIVRETHIAFYTEDIEKLHQALDARGLHPTPVKTSHWDGNQSFDLRPLRPRTSFLWSSFNICSDHCIRTTSERRFQRRGYRPT
jgi:catechol 2,3-dioxygenase-like lactoylglutathione lyase family enzyme